ncbi:hypothetical protein [Janibacter anophelis]|uniref:hypothetical protein n=1 Tax=Janibacter anophelis TaxID=319054 RepID=UPI0008327D50|nr:hypothetical protein [Janibacter anophelis]
MPIYPMAMVYQHGERLLVASMSWAKGRRPNGWFRHLEASVSDAVLAESVMGALERSRREDARDLPKPVSSDGTLVSEEMGFASWRSQEAATTLVGLTLVDGEVMVAPSQTRAGQGYRFQAELDPASGVEQIAARVREGLAESARLSERVVDHETIAAQQSSGVPSKAEDAAARALVDQIPDLARAVLTRHEQSWAVEALTSLSGPPREVPNGWVQVVPVGDPAVLAGVLVEALTHAGDDVADASLDEAAVVVDALGVRDRAELTSSGTVRIAVMTNMSTGDADLFPQELDEVSGWWATPEAPESRSVGIDDPLPLWGSTIEAMADDLARGQG